MNKKLLEILACPTCKGPLLYREQKQELICRLDKIAYPIREGIPVMLPEEGRMVNLEELEKL